MHVPVNVLNVPALCNVLVLCTLIIHRHDYVSLRSDKLAEHNSFLNTYGRGCILLKLIMCPF